MAGTVGMGVVWVCAFVLYAYVVGRGLDDGPAGYMSYLFGVRLGGVAIGTLVLSYSVLPYTNCTWLRPLVAILEKVAKGTIVKMYAVLVATMLLGAILGAWFLVALVALLILASLPIAWYGIPFLQAPPHAHDKRAGRVWSVLTALMGVSVWYAAIWGL